MTDSSNNQQISKMSTIQLKPDFGPGSSTNWRKSHAQKSIHNVQGGQNSIPGKAGPKETKMDWNNSTNSNWKNSTQSNWKNTSSSNWKNSTQTQWVNGTKVVLPKQHDASIDRSEESSSIITLDHYLGVGFKQLPLTGIGFSEFEGARPPQMDASEQQYLNEEFEINETDEDMYSESNTFSRYDMESKQKKKRKQRSKVQKREKSLDVENTVLIGDAKIKQKIIDKYSKSHKQKQMMGEKKSSLENLCKQEPEIIKLPAASPTCNRTKTTLLPHTDGQRKVQCTSQSPLRNNEVQSKLINDSSIIARGSQTNFSKPQLIKSYDDNKLVENHIAFRNSFYMNQKYQDVIEETKGANFKLLEDQRVAIGKFGKAERAAFQGQSRHIHSPSGHTKLDNTKEI